MSLSSHSKSINIKRRRGRKNPYSKGCGAQPCAQKALQNARRRSPHHRNSFRILFMHNGILYASIMTGESTTVRIACKGCSLTFNSGPRQTSTLPREPPHQSSPEAVNSHHIAFRHLVGAFNADPQRFKTDWHRCPLRW